MVERINPTNVMADERNVCYLISMDTLSIIKKK